MNVLLITYEFPPSGGVGVQRALSLARYLPETGFSVHVLTARNPASPVFDPGLLVHVPASVRVHRTWTLEPSYRIRKSLWTITSRRHPDLTGVDHRQRGGTVNRVRASFKTALARTIQRWLSPDPHVMWLPLAYRRACRLVENQDIEVVLTTAPPFSLLLLANRLKRRYPHLQMVSDFRDEWRRFFLKDFEFLDTARTRQRAEEIEHEAVRSSSLVVAVTQSSLDQLRNTYPHEADSKFVWIPNGYDPAAFRSWSARRHGTSNMVVTYVGTAYKVCSPRYYLDALDDLPDAIRSKIETRFIGRIIDEEQCVFQSRKSPLRVFGFLPQAEAFRWMEETDYLLVTVTNGFAIAGKLFEYLATGKPILAISPLDGEVARLIRETGAGWCVDPDDHVGIKQMLTMAYERLNGQTQPLARKPDVIGRFERPRLAAALAERIRGASEASLQADPAVSSAQRPVRPLA